MRRSQKRSNSLSRNRLELPVQLGSRLEQGFSQPSQSLHLTSESRGEEDVTRIDITVSVELLSWCAFLTQMTLPHPLTPSDHLVPSLILYYIYFCII